MSGGSTMKRLCVLALCVLGSVVAANAQTAFAPVAEDAATPSDAKYANIFALSDRPSSPIFSASNIFLSPFPEATRSSAPSYASSPAAAPLPKAKPEPQPRFWYGGRDDYRWQLALGIAWLRFQSSVFSASSVGFNASVTYFT